MRCRVGGCESIRPYRYGFNGKEQDNEVKGVGDQIDYGMRVYDPRGGRFLSVDPLTKKYPELTPFQYASNSPVSGIDLDGLEYYYSADGFLRGKIGSSTEVRIVSDDFVKQNAGSNKFIGKSIWDANSRDAHTTNDVLNTKAYLSSLKNTEYGTGGSLTYNTSHGFKGNLLNKFAKPYPDDKGKYSTHPPSIMIRGKLEDAMGAYQINEVTWKTLHGSYGMTDFTPKSQDKGAITWIWDRSHGSLADLLNGNYVSQNAKLKGVWTSLPGGAQQTTTAAEYQDIFKKNISKELNGKSNIALTNEEVQRVLTSLEGRKKR